jgi:tRNA-splicing ligase RtcB
MIKKVVMGTKVPAKLWLDDVEGKCLEQIVALASLPFVFKHVAMMPDAHAGKGMPIGGVLATKGVVVPNAVGVDIGCGMCAVKTSLKADELERKDLTGMMKYIRATVPLGDKHQQIAVDYKYLPEIDFATLPYLKNKREACLHEIGTLGGGNHSIEIQKDTATGDVWLMLHSGSRHIGYTVADYYDKIARFWNEKWFSETLPELAFLPIETPMAKDHLKEMNFCVQLAFANRKAIMDRMMEAVLSVRPETTFDTVINIAHNYAAFENHYGEDVVVHRKGATRAYAGEIGIIPGSMGTKSYIVEGLGNPESFMSCSHGAGRRLSRSAAFKTLSLKDEAAMMEAKGIIHGLRENGLDEAPSAYKDIDVVMENENDLVKPIVELVPLAVVKGN